MEAAKVINKVHNKNFIDSKKLILYYSIIYLTQISLCQDRIIKALIEVLIRLLITND